MGLADQFIVSRTGFLVLSRPGSNFPSIRANEDLRYQAMRADRGFTQLEAAANAAVEGHDTVSIQNVLSAARAYDSSCISFCDRASTCFKLTLDEGDAAILGEDVARFLGSVNLTRAMELLDGAAPRTAAEKDVAAQLNNT
jgi:hypothetical protein